MLVSDLSKQMCMKMKVDQVRLPDKFFEENLWLWDFFYMRLSHKGFRRFLIEVFGTPSNRTFGCALFIPPLVSLPRI